MLTLLRSKSSHIAFSTLCKAAEILKLLLDNVNLTEEFDLIYKKLIDSIVTKLWRKYKILLHTKNLNENYFNEWKSLLRIEEYETEQTSMN